MIGESFLGLTGEVRLEQFNLTQPLHGLNRLIIHIALHLIHNNISFFNLCAKSFNLYVLLLKVFILFVE